MPSQSTAPDPADTVLVPRELVEALREAVGHTSLRTFVGSTPVGRVIFTAHTVVAAADSPPVDEACTCGESVPTATTPGPCYWAENAPGVQSQVHCPPTAPSPSTREAWPTCSVEGCGHVLKAGEDGCPERCHADAGATREPVPTQLTDEEVWTVLNGCGIWYSTYPGNFKRVKAAVESILTARLSASTDRAERAEAQRDEAKRRALSAANERDEQRRMKEGNITALNKACAERDALAAKLEAAEAKALNDAADAIQALHPGEVKNSVIFLRERAAAVQSVQETDQ